MFVTPALLAAYARSLWVPCGTLPIPSESVLAGTAARAMIARVANIARLVRRSIKALPYIYMELLSSHPRRHRTVRERAGAFADAKALAFARARSSACRGDRVHRPGLPRAPCGNARHRLALNARLSRCALRGTGAPRRRDDGRAVRRQRGERHRARASRYDRAAPSLRR